MDVRCWTRTRIAGWMDGGAEQLCVCVLGQASWLHSDITNNNKPFTQCLPAYMSKFVGFKFRTGCQEPVGNR